MCLLLAESKRPTEDEDEKKENDPTRPRIRNEIYEYVEMTEGRAQIRD